ncbi:hypothetical protein PGIN_ATCC49417_01678 [Porphyromonas gingivalis]|nr:hypothetical protein PGIN_ATCC49417_01678 [Porphyromonas gingivalis]
MGFRPLVPEPLDSAGCKAFFNISPSCRGPHQVIHLLCPSGFLRSLKALARYTSDKPAKIRTGLFFSPSALHPVFESPPIILGLDSFEAGEIGLTGKPVSRRQVDGMPVACAKKPPTRSNPTTLIPRKCGVIRRIMLSAPVIRVTYHVLTILVAPVPVL